MAGLEQGQCQDTLNHACHHTPATRHFQLATLAHISERANASGSKPPPKTFFSAPSSEGAVAPAAPHAMPARTSEAAEQPAVPVGRVERVAVEQQEATVAAVSDDGPLGLGLLADLGMPPRVQRQCRGRIVLNSFSRFRSSRKDE